MKTRRGRTVGRNTPRGSRRACLCKDGRYSRKCCKGYLQNQGIGQIGVAGPPQYNDPVIRLTGSFNDDFNSDFDI
jgi:hypothetical protein